jgi:hypothetical protein
VLAGVKSKLTLGYSFTMSTIRDDLWALKIQTKEKENIPKIIKYEYQFLMLIVFFKHRTHKSLEIRFKGFIESSATIKELKEFDSLSRYCRGASQILACQLVPF